MCIGKFSFSIGYGTSMVGDVARHRNIECKYILEIEEENDRHPDTVDSGT